MLSHNAILPFWLHANKHKTFIKTSTQSRTVTIYVPRGTKDNLRETYTLILRTNNKQLTPLNTNIK
jgi:hypothetical protein